MIEDVYFLTCIYLNDLEIPQCFEFLESRPKFFSVCLFICTCVIRLVLSFNSASLSISRCLGMFLGSPLYSKFQMSSD